MIEVPRSSRDLWTSSIERWLLGRDWSNQFGTDGFFPKITVTF